MNVDELLEVLLKINRTRKKPVDEDALKQIIALVIKNPLDEDRAQCQEQMNIILSQRIGKNKHDN